MIEPLAAKMVIDAPQHILLSIHNIGTFLALVGQEKFVKAFVARFVQEEGKQNCTKEELARVKGIAELTYNDLLRVSKTVLDNMSLVGLFDVSIDFKKSLNPPDINNGIEQQKTAHDDDLFGGLDLPGFKLDG